MSIGYACLTIGVPLSNFRTCTIKNAYENNLMEIIQYNLNSLENIIDYNINNHIKLFRITSDLIPFGSSPVNEIPWENIFSERLLNIGEKILTNNIRVSMHPGQYTVLNSPNPQVVKNAIEDLNYHTKVLDYLGLGSEHKIVLHIGGVYNDKPMSMERFITNYQKLKDSVKKRLVIENDDKSYTIEEVLYIGKRLNCPVIFDNLHNKINPSMELKSEFDWIKECKNTWKTCDGLQKIHYSQQNPLKNPGSHSETIRVQEFLDFYFSLNRQDIDIMLEVKDKNLSAIKCINATTSNKDIYKLEQEWSKYKYTILEKSHSDYLEIRQLLKKKEEYPVITFYNIIERALQNEYTVGGAVNAAQHVWGYFKEYASDKEKESFLKNMMLLEKGKISTQRIKKQLWSMAEKYKQTYLLNCYYFNL